MGVGVMNLSDFSRSFQSAQELVIAIACISGLLFMIFMSTCVYRFYQEKQQDLQAESLSRILLSDSSCTASEAATPTTYFNPGVDPLTPTTDLDVRAAFLPEHHPYRNVPPPGFRGSRSPYTDSLMQSTQFWSPCLQNVQFTAIWLCCSCGKLFFELKFRHSMAKYMNLCRL